MADNYFKRVMAQTPTNFWINNVTREEAKVALEAGAVGCTQNPSYTWKMLSSESDGDYAKELLRKILADEPDDTMAEVKLQRELVAKVAQEYIPLYESSHHKQGYVSIQGDPFHEDYKTIVECARYNREAAPNIMAKVPVTPEGLKAIETLIAEGCPINATECMAVRQVLDLCEVYDRVAKEMENPPVVYFSLITGIFDEYMKKYVEEKKIDISPDVLWQGGFAVAKKVHQLVAERKYNVGFIGGGARGLHHFTRWSAQTQASPSTGRAQQTSCLSRTQSLLTDSAHRYRIPSSTSLRRRSMSSARHTTSTQSIRQSTRSMARSFCSGPASRMHGEMPST